MNRDGDDNNLGDVALQEEQEDPEEDNDNAEVEDDQEEEDDQDHDDDDDGDGDGDEDRVLDGGVAGSSNNNADDSSTGPAAARRRAADCDLILYITCAETMDDLMPHHPILKEGVVVSIGLDKNTKLGAVFQRYTEFVNENSDTSSSTDRVEESDLEFFHCQLLNANDTAESSALMKNDRIKVRRERANERETAQEFKRIQRESDKEYFKQLRHLLPEWSGEKRSDLIIDCQGKIADEIGRNQQVLSTRVWGHSVVLAKRCSYLRSMIQTAREEKLKRGLMTSDGDVADNSNEKDDVDIQPGSPQSYDDNGIEFPKGNIVANHSSTLPEDNEEPRRREDGDMDDDDDDDDEIKVLPYPVPHNNRPEAALQRSGATEIENDDDNDDNNSDAESVGPRSMSNNNRNAREMVPKDTDARSNEGNKLWITLPNHAPEAVKVLLEYCYTNRVISLGYDAFMQSCKTKPIKTNGPISPFSSARRWPNNGLPQVSFSVALAGITLAEEAGMHRLSLMCEVAASQLVTQFNVVEALSTCTSQKMLTGNHLPRLREVAINTVLRYGPRGVYEREAFREALEGRTTSIIPTLFSGTQEAIANADKQKNETKKRNFEAITESYYDELDREDAYRRERERRGRRLERYENNPELAAGRIIDNDDDGGDMFTGSWASETARRSLKRMSQHLNPSGFHVGRSGVYHSARDSSFGGGRAGGYGVVKRRSSSRRRSSERP